MNTSANDGMCQLDSNSQAEDFVDGNNILLHRPTVQKCVDKYDELKQKYDELVREFISLPDKIRASENRDLVKKETSYSENKQSEDDNVCDGESVSENSQTEMQSAKKIARPLSRMSTPLNKLLNVLRGTVKLSRSEHRQFISTCHNDFFRYFAFFAREIVSGNFKPASYQLKKLRRQKRLVKT